MSLHVEIEAEIGPLRVSAAFTVAPGKTLAVVGPNGAGKSTLLRAIAGLVPLRSGRVEVEGVVLEDTADGTFVPASERRIGFVFQDLSLFPHLTAAGNVAFGLRARGEPRRSALSTATAVLERFDTVHLARRPAGSLSGGEAARVALARALAVEPRVLLLDEPLTALDAAARPQLRRLLRREIERAGVPAVVVTHDPVDSFALADRVAVIEAGTIVQEGSAQDLVARPRSSYAAEFAGVNVLEGIAGQAGVAVGDVVLAVPGASSGPVLVAVYPHAIALHQQPPGGSPRNVWQANVMSVERFGATARVVLGGPFTAVAEVTTAALDSLGIAPGSVVHAAVKATELSVYPA